MKKNQGMTLIELMVVICIIGILATVVLNVGRGVVLKSQIQSTQSTILALSNACEQYHALYYCYPWLKQTNTNGNFNPNSQPINEAIAPNQINANRSLRYALEEFTPGVEMDISEDPVLTQNLPKERVDNLDNSRYIDAWSEPLYVCYGRNHRGDTPSGPNNYGPHDNNNKQPVNSTPLDIISAGPNGKLESEGNGTGATIYRFNNAGIDDIVSWMLNINKSFQNTMDN